MWVLNEWLHALPHSSKVTQGLARSGYTEEAWFSLGCLSLHMCTCMCVHDNEDSCCGEALSLTTPTHTYPYYSNPNNSTHGSRRSDCWKLYLCWLKCWATMPWQPSFNLLSTLSPLLLCCDSHHNSCCLWTCQAARDTKMTKPTFDIRSVH